MLKFSLVDAREAIDSTNAGVVILAIASIVKPRVGYGLGHVVVSVYVWAATGVKRREPLAVDIEYDQQLARSGVVAAFGVITHFGAKTGHTVSLGRAMQHRGELATLCAEALGWGKCWAIESVKFWRRRDAQHDTPDRPSATNLLGRIYPS